MQPLKLHTSVPAGDTQPAADPFDRERLIDRAEFCRLLSISRPTFERLLARSRVLPPVRLGRTLHRWRLRDVLDWLRDGAPDPGEWLAGRGRT